MLESNRDLHVDHLDDQGLSTFYHAYANRHWVASLLAAGLTLT